jgi:hypothetical protein
METVYCEENQTSLLSRWEKGLYACWNVVAIEFGAFTRGHDSGQSSNHTKGKS